MDNWIKHHSEHNYSVSIKWEIRNDRTWRILKQVLSTNWYTVVHIWWKTRTAHRFIAQAFMWESELDVNHKNWVKTDNRIQNLEYCTRSENIKHRFKVLWHKSSHSWKFWKNHHRSVKVKQIDKEWNTIKIWDSIMDINRQLWLTHVSEVCRWRRKTTWWFTWKYY